jgi:hypothetical protein
MAELERQRVASAQAAATARRFESCCLRLSQSGVVELARRAVVTREIAGSIPAAGASHALVVEAGNDAGPSTRKLRVRVPPRVLNDRRDCAGHDVRHLAVGELATPPALEAGDRRFESCQPDLAR